MGVRNQNRNQWKDGSTLSLYSSRGSYTIYNMLVGHSATVGSKQLKIKHRLRARWGGCQGGDLNITRRTESRAGDETEYEGGYRGPLCQAGTPELYIAYTFRS